MANIYEVAELAGVSLATVSRVINPGAKVSDKTRQRVLDAMQQLGYQPNSIAQSLATRSHEVIRHWAEERRAAPATTPGTDPQRPRMLRFNFPGYDKDLQEVSWDAWFGTFDERDLVFVFQEHMKAGNPSNFFKLDSPGHEAE